MDNYEKEFSQWLHIKNLKDQQTSWHPCEYFDQLNIASASGHSILNYPMFFGLLPSEKILPPRELLILDEAHLIETEIVRFRGLSISKRRWKKYIPTLEMVDYGYDDIEKWIDFLVDLESKMFDLTGNNLMIEALSTYRKDKYNWISKNASPQKKKVVAVSEIFENDDSISEKYETNFSRFGGSNISEEIAVEALIDTEKLTRTINSILSNPMNWIVSEIKKENYEVIRVEFKPLDISQYWKAVVGKCNKTLMMSATLLDKDAFCTSLDLTPTFHYRTDLNLGSISGCGLQ